MTRRGERSVGERLRIFEMRKAGYSLSAIAKQHNLSKVGVKKICDKIQETGHAETRPRTGRKRRTTKRQDNLIVREIKKNPLVTVKEIKVSLDLPIELTQIRQRITEAGYHGRICRKKPLISKVNAAKRLQFAYEHLNKPIEFWQNIIRSDESKFEILNNNRRQYVWRKPGEAFKKSNIKVTVKHGGGSIMTWGCFSARGLGNLVIINDKLTAVRYIDILKENLFNSAAKMEFKNDFIFQQDNDPKHKAKVTMKYFEENNIQLLQWPPQSPDLNPIEHLWDHLKRNVPKSERKNKNVFIDALKLEWENIGTDVINKLICSMPNRLKGIIKAKGYHTRY